jgi:predicted ABC-class ATPase
MTAAELLRLLPFIASSVAAIASWCTVIHLSLSWKKAQAAATYSRLVREPMRVAHSRYDDGIRVLVEQNIADEELAKRLRQLVQRYLSAVRPLRSVQSLNICQIVEDLEKMVERFEDELSNFLASNHSSPLLSGQLDSILEAHATELADLLEYRDPGQPRRVRRSLALTPTKNS